MKNSIQTIDFKTNFFTINAEVFSNLQDAKNYIADNISEEEQTINRIGVQIISSDIDGVEDDKYYIYESYSDSGSDDYYYFAVKQ